MTEYRQGELINGIPVEWKAVFLFNKEKSDELLIQDINGNNVISANQIGETLHVYLQFDAFPRPLLLTAKLGHGQHEICLIYSITRIALYVDTEIRDEEFPVGSIHLNGARLIAVPEKLTIDNDTSRYGSAYEDGGGTFKGLHMWKPDFEGVNSGDAIPFSHDGRYHIFFLIDRRRANSKWCNLAHRWGHLASTDMQNWEYLPMAVNIEHQNEATIATGSAVSYMGKYFLYYGIRMIDGTPAQIHCSVSDDGITFVRTNYSVSLTEPYHSASARDPHVFIGDDNLLHMLVTTSIKVNSEWKGCLAHLVSSDGVSWLQQKEPFMVLDDADYKYRTSPEDLAVVWEHPGEGISVNIYDNESGIEPCDTGEQPECPDYFQFNGKYYFTYNLQGYCRYYCSDKPFGDWTRPEDNRIAGPLHRVPKFAKYKDERIFAVPYVALTPGYAGVLNLMELKQDENGRLFLSDWE